MSTAAAKRYISEWFHPYQRKTNIEEPNNVVGENNIEHMQIDNKSTVPSVVSPIPSSWNNVDQGNA